MHAGTPTRAVTLRPVTAKDRDFLVQLYGSTREEELSQVTWPAGAREAFVRMQFEAQDVDYRRNNPGARFDLIEVDGEPAGRLYVAPRAGDLRIVDISLMPEFRGLGVGTSLLNDLQREATAAACILSIHVERTNRASELYARLGFRVAAEGDVYRRMEWSAP